MSRSAAAGFARAPRVAGSERGSLARTRAARTGPRRQDPPSAHDGCRHGRGRAHGVAGYREARRHYEMAIELDAEPPAPELSDGLSVDTFREEEAREFHDAIAEAFADEWGFVPMPFEEWWEMRNDDDKSLWFVVRDGERIAAYARCEAGRHGGGFVGMIGVRRDWRKTRPGARAASSLVPRVLGARHHACDARRRLGEPDRRHAALRERWHEGRERERDVREGACVISLPARRLSTTSRRAHGVLRRSWNGLRSADGEGEAEIRHLLTTPMFDVEADFRIAAAEDGDRGLVRCLGPEQGAPAPLPRPSREP